MKAKLFLPVLMCALLLCGCFSANQKYEFRQDFEQIATIEILKKEYDSIDINTPMNVIKTIDPQQHRAMIDALVKAKSAPMLAPPSTGVGMYIIRITYLDGEIELLGDYNIAYISPDGELYQDRFFFYRDDFYAVISEFLGEETYWPPK